MLILMNALTLNDPVCHPYIIPLVIGIPLVWYLPRVNPVNCQVAAEKGAFYSHLRNLTRHLGRCTRFQMLAMW